MGSRRVLGECGASGARCSYATNVPRRAMRRAAMHRRFRHVRAPQLEAGYAATYFDSANSPSRWAGDPSFDTPIRDATLPVLRFVTNMPMLSSIVFGLAAGASGILASQHLYVDLHAEASHGKPYDQARNYSEPYVPTHLLGGQAASLNFTQVASEPHFQIFDRDLAEAILAPNTTITQILKNDDDYWWAHEAPIYFPQTDVRLTLCQQCGRKD